MEPGVLFGVTSAAAFGSGDFAGGLASRRAPVLAVAAGAQVIGLVLLLLVLAVAGAPAPEPQALTFGAIAGLFGGFGLLALYRGLSLGSMGLVAAVSGAGSVAIPVLIGVVLLGNRIGAAQWLGILSAGAAAALASGVRLAGVDRNALRLAGLAALGFGLWFVFLDVAADSQEIWALVASRASASALIGSLVLALARDARLGRAWPLMAAAGALDVTGNTAFVLATASVPVGVAAALSGLYPIVTMLLARWVLREALPALGLAAVALAVVGIVLISPG